MTPLQKFDVMILSDLSEPQPVTVKEGTPYATSKGALFATQYEPIPGTKPGGKSSEEAVREVKDQSDRVVNGLIPKKIKDAIERLRNACRCAVTHPNEWGLDLLIKMFADLDVVFFNGKLLGNVGLRWRAVQPTYAGCTQMRGQGRALISLNPDLAKPGCFGAAHPLTHLISLLLHEMCHAYHQVRVRVQPQFESHNPFFYGLLRAVHRTARVTFGIMVFTTLRERPDYLQVLLEDIQADEALGLVRPIFGPLKARGRSLSEGERDAVDGKLMYLMCGGK